MGFLRMVSLLDVVTTNDFIAYEVKIDDSEFLQGIHVIIRSFRFLLCL